MVSTNFDVVTWHGGTDECGDAWEAKPRTVGDAAVKRDPPTSV